MASQEPRRGLPAEAGRYLGIGLTWALSTALFLYLGTWVDRWVGTESVCALLGAFIGAAAGFYYMYHHLVGESARRPGRDQRDGRP